MEKSVETNRRVEPVVLDLTVGAHIVDGGQISGRDGHACAAIIRDAVELSTTSAEHASLQLRLWDLRAVLSQTAE